MNASAFTTAIPGKAWWLRAKSETRVPYAVFTFQENGSPEYVSDGSYTQNWTMRLGVYSDQAVSDPKVIQLAAVNAINVYTVNVALRDGKILHVLPMGWDGKFAPQLRQASDVFVSGSQWSLLVNGNLAPAGGPL